MIIKIIYRKSGAENFRTMTLETADDLLIGCLQECVSFNSIMDVLKQFKGKHTEVKSETPDLVLDISTSMEKHVRQMYKAYGKKYKYSA